MNNQTSYAETVLLFFKVETGAAASGVLYNAVAMTTFNLMPHQKLFIDANELAEIGVITTPT